MSRWLGVPRVEPERDLLELPIKATREVLVLLHFPVAVAVLVAQGQAALLLARAYLQALQARLSHMRQEEREALALALRVMRPLIRVMVEPVVELRPVMGQPYPVATVVLASSSSAGQRPKQIN
jgi:hypothetical protein